MQLMISVWNLAHAFLATLAYKLCYTLTAVCMDLCAMHNLPNSVLLAYAHPTMIKHCLVNICYIECA